MFSSFYAARWFQDYRDLTDYIGVAQLYLKENFFLQEPLKPEHIKDRILGHWGTVPGLNFIYAHLNYLISQEHCSMFLVTGPGHGAPSILANLVLEGSLKAVYPDYGADVAGVSKLIHDFSWPHSPFPSHVTPGVPGSILEGGELGYSLATAYGAVMDQPDLIATCVVGDGEAETGAIATAWHSNKFLNPKTSGAVLPILHLNGYKISNPTLLSRMGNDELHSLFWGYGYEPMIVEGSSMDAKMRRTLKRAYDQIRAIQKKARSQKGAYLKPRWPVILLRSVKGWRGLHDFAGHSIEGSFRSHGIPLESPKKDPAALIALEKWLKSYRVERFLESNGTFQKNVLRFVPDSKLRMGTHPAVMNPSEKPLKLPDLKDYAVKFKGRGCESMGTTPLGAELLRDVFKKNPTRFRLFCPDEAESNKLGAIFEVTPRAFMWPLDPNDEHMHPEGRVMEMLSEHTLQGWLMGYLLTGRYGLFASYEAFTTIISSMVDQYAKFLKQCSRVAWRPSVPSAIYLQTSVGWRQDHNGYSHQNPSFVSNILQKHGEFCQVYYPPDANSFLVALEETLTSRNKICVIVADKREMPQWLTLDEARKQAKVGLGIWDWVTSREASAKPDVVLASAGDAITMEALYAVQLCEELAPELKIRYVNISELTALSVGDNRSAQNLQKYFTADKPVVINYHGYTNDLEHILWGHADPKRFSLHGYCEEGSTTTPFDLKVANKVSFYHVAEDLLMQGAKSNEKLAAKLPALRKEIQKRIKFHQDYIRKNGDDPKEVKTLCWLV